jgi:putative ABC transport system substrate-binding protein
VLAHAAGSCEELSSARLPAAIPTEVPMRLIGLAVVLILSLALAPLAAVAQQAGRVARVGYLSNIAPPSTEELMKGIAANPFWTAMRELGWMEGQNMVVERRWGQSPDQLGAAAAELVRLKVDVIVANGTPAPLAARRATSAIPIVMVGAGDPVATGLVSSLAKPGGNVTGTSNQNPETTGKRLQLTKEVVPGLSRLAVLWNAANPVNALVVKEAKAAAQTLGLQVQSVEVRGPDDFETALPAAVSGGAGALFVADDSFLFQYRTRIADFAAQHRLPTMFSFRLFVDAGGLMSYGPILADLTRRAAAYVDKILRGAKPVDLPVEQPTKFELVINLKTAKALGLTIPQSVLVRADEIIQ